MHPIVLWTQSTVISSLGIHYGILQASTVCCHRRFPHLAAVCGLSPFFVSSSVRVRSVEFEAYKVFFNDTFYTEYFAWRISPLTFLIQSAPLCAPKRAPSDYVPEEGVSKPTLIGSSICHSSCNHWQSICCQKLLLTRNALILISYPRQL